MKKQLLLSALLIFVAGGIGSSQSESSFDKGDDLLDIGVGSLFFGPVIPHLYL